ncbi:hypothetical protein LPAF129_21080 [Ligilactobacillus pabuli]|uniref:Uncharacterized protein n=1 Tax=Ligilactobacillus pabuli TaxID=2886039 RepID=A0ABQ5JK32_9LACO|nr:hypothetical protein LPAF129_21080 [Ligilactobacillus pabuli]
MQIRTKKFLMWLSIFIVSVILDVVFLPEWRSLLYFILRLVETVAIICCVTYFPKKN